MSMAALSMLLIGSCSGKAPLGVTLDETPVISGGLGWGVVSLSYVRLMLEPSSSADDSGTARRGEIGKISARSRVFSGRDSGVWYRVEIGDSVGWLREESILVYRSEAEARKAAEAGA